jgi:hypothetical protein
MFEFQVSKRGQGAEPGYRLMMRAWSTPTGYESNPIQFDIGGSR